MMFPFYSHSTSVVGYAKPALSLYIGHTPTHPQIPAGISLPATTASGSLLPATGENESLDALERLSSVGSPCRFHSPVVELSTSMAEMSMLFVPGSLRSCTSCVKLFLPKQLIERAKVAQEGTRNGAVSHKCAICRQC